jgi:group I intron endonuclease
MKLISLQPGIYKISNLITKKCYIGSTTSLRRRYYEHFSDLKLNQHHSSKLQRSYNKHGKSQFIFEVLLYCEKSLLLLYEQKAIEVFDAYTNGYNEAPKAGSPLGRPAPSEETRRKISLWHTGKKHTEEHIAKFRLAMVGKKHTQEHIDKCVQAKLGTKQSAETKLKISASVKGKPKSEEHKQKISAAKLGKTIKSPSKEHREKLSIVAKSQNRAISPEQQAKMQAGRKR